jgi:glucose dehydrogenase
MRITRRELGTTALALVLTAKAAPLFAQTPPRPAPRRDALAIGTHDGQWPTYGGDLASTRYSPLDQINAGNFG